MNYINRFVNTETNMASYVNYHAKGFSVSVKDLDADIFLPSIRIFAIESQAVEYAKKVVEL